MKTVEEFLDAGCELAQPVSKLAIFILIHERTRADPCTTGCAFFKDGACLAYRKLFPDASVRHVKPPRSMRVDSGYVKPSKKPFRW